MVKKYRVVEEFGVYHQVLFEGSYKKCCSYLSGLDTSDTFLSYYILPIN